MRYVVSVLLAALCSFAQTSPHPMALAQTRYVVRAGEPARITASDETRDFLLRARSRRVSIDGLAKSGLVVGPNHQGDQLLLASSLRTKPGEYTVTLSATGESGEERETTLDVVVQALTPVPSNATRRPVVLLNGWEEGFTGTCPISVDSTATFGNLAQYLGQDGVPVIYLFDNCAEDPGQPIEVLGEDLNTVLNLIKYDSGAQVPQIDLVGFSMGGLIARSYLAGLQLAGNYLPPTPTLVGKMVQIATPNFGSFVAGNYINLITAGTQDAELEPGSSFLWNLATWNQHRDDLRGVDTIAIIGNAGTYLANLTSATGLANASDGLVSLTSAALGFAAGPVESSPTRIVPYCHVDPYAFLNTSFGSYLCNAPGIANVTSTTHLTGEIVRSFLAGTTTWTSIGTAPSADPYLSKNGALYVALVAANGVYAADLTSVSFGSVGLQTGGDISTIFYYDFIFGSSMITLASQSLGTVNCMTLALPLGYTSTERCKIATDVFTVTPMVSGGGFVVTAGSTVTLNAAMGSGFGSQCSNCKVQATAAGSSTSQVLSVTSWTNSAISVKLPAGLIGFLTLTVIASAGNDSIGVIAEPSSTIAVTPTSLQFAYATGGTVPAAQPIQISNSGTGTLAWSATTSNSWLSLSATSGTAPSTPTVSVNPSGMSIGTYNGTIMISATGASNSPVTVNVTLTVGQAVTGLAVSPATLSFQYTAGGALPAAQNVSIGNTGSGTLSWTASADSFWLGLSASSGTTPGTLSITANGANLAAGTYTGTVMVSAAGVSPVPIAMTLTVAGTQSAGTITAVVNGGSFAPGVAPATWLSIFGTNLSQVTYSWQASDFVNGMLPTSLQGVSVTIDGLPAYIAYISPTQINVLAPDDSTVGAVQVQVTTAQQASNSITVQEAAFSPAFFTLDGTHVAAPAQPGDTIVIYGVGFGPVTPSQPAGQLVTSPAPLANTVTFTIGGQPATVQFAGLVESGLYQFNVTVPALPNGDAAVIASINSVTSQSGVQVTVQ